MRKPQSFTVWSLIALSTLAAGSLVIAQDKPPASPDKPADEGGKKDKPEFPPFDQVSKDFERVISTADDAKSLWTVYVNKKKNKMLAELPAQFDGQRIFVATSIAGGSRQTGFQWNDLYCYWTRLGSAIFGGVKPSA